MLDRLKHLREQALAELSRCADDDQLERWRIAYLGKKGALTGLLRVLGEAPPDQRPAMGQTANSLKQELEQAHAHQQQVFKQRAREVSLTQQPVDVTLPGRPPRVGGLHPVTRTIDDSLMILRQMGFQVVETPEVELDYYNFEVLNIPPDHPARDMWDTIYVDPPTVLLRTQTTAYQGRVLAGATPPVRVANVGRCYRFEAVDASHEWMFYQIDGLAVDVGLTMADLKGTLNSFARQIFWPDVRTRFRCDYFPFVEPGVEMSISCHACKGQGGACPVCRGAGWLEILGAGMVHPKVLTNVGLDPERYSGFAWGMGPERIAMIKYGIQDIRLFYSNDLRFLEQFV